MNMQQITANPGEKITASGLTDHERELAQWMHIDLERDRDELLRSAAYKANRSIQLFVEVGIELIAAQDRCTDGEWEPLLNSLGIPSQRASEHIRVARFMARVKPADRTKMLGLPKTKVMLLAQADDEVIESLVENEQEFDATTALTVQEMRSRLKQLEKDNYALGLRLDTAQAERDRALQLKQPDIRWNSDVQEIRDESTQLSGAAMQALDDLEQVLVKLALELPRLVPQDERGASQYRAAASVTYQSIVGPLGRAARLLNRFKDDYGLTEYCSDQTEDLPLLSDTEARQFYDNWKMMVRLASIAKQDREMRRRHEAHKGRPGPKPGSKNKKTQG